MTVFNEIKQTKEFKRDFKKLLKRFKTLNDDLDNFIEFALKPYHKHNTDNGGIVRIANINIDYPIIYKARKFSCQSLKGKGSRTGIRIIYAYFMDKDMIEFIEIYYKGDKELSKSTFDKINLKVIKQFTV